MNRAASLLLVCAYLAIAALPIAWKALGLREQRIRGALPPTELPALTLSSVTDESFQRGFTRWFERERGLLGHAIHVDNGVLYRLFHETRVGSRVRLGRGRVLFLDEDLDYLNASGPRIPAPAELDRLADAIARAQRTLASGGRALVPVIIPSKTSIYRDAVDPRWLRDPSGDVPSDEHLYRRLADALARRGVAFVDMRAALASARESRGDLWGPEARHWSFYGACLANQGVLARAAELVARPVPAYPCRLIRVPPSPGHDDHDLLRLLNVWKLRPVSPTVPVAAHDEPIDPAAPRPRPLYVGTSFTQTLIKDAAASRRFGPIHLHYYDSQLVAWPEDTSVPAASGSPAWRDLIAGKDLLVLDLLEVYVGGGETYVDRFLVAIERAAPSLPPAP